MTLTSALTFALARRGDHTVTSQLADRARDYFNIICTTIDGLANWRWLYKTATLTTVASQRAYPLAADVLVPLQFWDTTNDRWLNMTNPDDVIFADPDEDETGEGMVWTVTGRNATTGYWEVDVAPSTDTAGETITYRYRAFLATLTSSEDSSDLLPYMPPAIQNAAMWGAAALLKEERNQRGTNSTAEWKNYDMNIGAAAKINKELDVPPRIVMGQGDSSSITVTI